MRRRLALASTALLLAGCSLAPRPSADEMSVHLLDARPAVASPIRRDLVLAVSAPHAAPGADTTAMVYLRTAHALDRYATHRWADAPARMLAPLLVRTLDDAGVFRAVVPPGSGLAADLRLDTEIVTLRQSFLAPPSRVELMLRVQLVDMAARGVLATRYIETTGAAPSDDAPGGVAAAQEALGRALAAVAAFCADASGERRSP